MDFEHKSFNDSFDSSFTYMDGGLDYFHYPDSPLGVNVGLPQTGSPMDFTLPMTEYTYSSASFSPASPPRPYSPPESIAPQALVYSDDSRTSRGSGSQSPPAIPYAATVPRSHRFNPIAVPANRPSRVAAAHRRTRSTRSHDSDDEDDEEFKPDSNAGSNNESAPRDSRRETVRKQRIESEQRRRDELRDGYTRLKDVLPPTNMKASKVSLLERATTHIKNLEQSRTTMAHQLKSAEHEVHRLRTVNEALMLNRSGAAPIPPTVFPN